MFRLKYLPNKEPDEKIIFFLRRHPFVLMKSLIIFFLIALLPLAVYYMLADDLAGWPGDEVFMVLLRLLIVSFYLFWWLLLYYVWLDYFLDIWIVTNFRVINIEQEGLFNRKVIEHKLFRVQDVMSLQKGMLPTFLNYGEVHIQTAGAESNVTFEQVPQPHKVAQQVIKLIENNKRHMGKIMAREEENDDLPRA